MTLLEPVTELDSRYSAPGASATPWAEAVRQLERTETFWINTVRADGRPHATPLLAVWDAAALHFCTGAQEQKARNLAASSQCLLLTSGGAAEGLVDVVVEGTAERVTDHPRLAELAAGWWTKYGEPWRFEVVDGAFRGGGGNGNIAHVFAVRPVTGYAYRQEDPFGMTRYRF